MDLKLYMFDTCPFCRKVMREIESQGRTDVELKNVHKSKENMAELMDVGGKSQVPCLFIEGEPLYESDDIIEWLREHPQDA